jgi:hypothetical protein
VKRRRKTRLAGLLTIAVAVSFACGTACAMQRRAMGPMACCKTNCQHEGMPKQTDAERCCQSHLTALPTAAGSGLKSLAAAAVPVGAFLPAMLPPPSVVLADPLRVARTGPAPRAPTLLAQHTSLLR